MPAPFSLYLRINTYHHVRTGLPRDLLQPKVVIFDESVKKSYQCQLTLIRSQMIIIILQYFFYV